MQGILDTARDRRISVERGRSEQVLERVLPRVTGKDAPDRVSHFFRGSNDLLEVRLGTRRLMIKRGLEPWSADRFRTARIAACRIAATAPIRTPQYLGLPENIRGWPVLAWWRIELPTLKETWPRLDEGQRRRALRSLGALLARLHDLGTEAWGPLASVGDGSEGGSGFLEADLEHRLRPAAWGSWPDALPLVDGLLSEVRDEWRAPADPCLVHNDVHLANVLCSPDGEGNARCVGLLDLEAAGGAVPEADLSYLALVHSPLMAGHLGDGWMERVSEGHGGIVDARTMRLLRIYHVLNIGIHAALNGLAEKAAHLADLGRASL